MLAAREEVVQLLMWELEKFCQMPKKNLIEQSIISVIPSKVLKPWSARPFIFGKKRIFAQVRRVPLGVALIMGPYNYP